MIAKFRNVLLLIIALAMVPCAEASVDLATTSVQDETFRQLREAARKQDASRAARLADSLRDYPVPSYVDYYLLKSDLPHASEAEVDAYLSRYKGSAIADRLRNDWLLILGQNGNWDSFDKHYPLFELDDDTQVKCYALMSRAAKGVNVAREARLLLTKPKKYGEACYALISDLVEKKQLGDDDIWYQSRLSAENNLTALAIRIAGLSGVSKTDISKALELPAAVLSAGPGADRNSHEIYLLALGRTAKKDREMALQYFNEALPSLTAKEQALGWSMMALPASIALSPDALEYWKKASAADISMYAHEWKVRTALRKEDWRLVYEWINQMPPSLQKEPVWIYWKGRALLAQGQRERAHKLFASIADQCHFYGQLALEELGRKINARPERKLFSESEIAAMSDNSGFQLAQKFFKMDWRFEGIREWNWQLRKMDERQLLAAAEYARKVNLLDRMINTSDRTKNVIDFTQRFPTPFRENVKVATEQLGLDMAWTYGLVRQESRFVMNARSAVGASGLMQLMPATARYVAKKIGLTGYRHGKINSLETNVLLGTNYLNMVLNDLEGSQVMATAAYNAGPGRPKTWRSTLSRTVDGAIFAETIPFTETRDYVKNVMSNATYYAALFEAQPQSLKKRLGHVIP
ncbi:lytic transglycosylase domain-containing protein [Oxalobacter paraformigenes]|uniref:Transglycosylase SLT domain-containing protein n=1 Tax=Oxalobacter paraformigenes TaxID=556268 RepID=C3X681_9BURK|nr:lytic transglycosylase domain-containing protein [Oxalobacter paraformigenes]EEO28717.1 hypothetical protein OFAG_01870 [Oxalobacter paraformigenes]